MNIRRGPVVSARVGVRPVRVGVYARPAVRYGVRPRVVVGPRFGPRFGPRVVAPRYVGGRYVGGRLVGGRYVGGRYVGPPLRRYWSGGRWITRPWDYAGPRFIRRVGVPGYYDGGGGVPLAAGVVPDAAPDAVPDAEPIGGYPRRWIFRRRPPAWLLRLLAPYGTAFRPPPRMAEPAGPPPGEPPEPPPADAGPRRRRAAGPGGPPPDAGPGDGPDPSAAAPGGGGGPGGEAPTGELPAMVHVDGQGVPIRWASAAREIGEPMPRGGGVYVVLRNGVPEAAHLANDFASDISRRYAAASGGETESEAEAEGEWGYRRRWGFGRRRGRRSFLFGRPGRGRWRRRRFLASLRSRMGVQDQQPQEPEPPEQ